MHFGVSLICKFLTVVKEALARAELISHHAKIKSINFDRYLEPIDQIVKHYFMHSYASVFGPKLMPFIQELKSIIQVPHLPIWEWNYAEEIMVHLGTFSTKARLELNRIILGEESFRRHIHGVHAKHEMQKVIPKIKKTFLEGLDDPTKRPESYVQFLLALIESENTEAHEKRLFYDLLIANSYHLPYLYGTLITQIQSHKYIPLGLARIWDDIYAKKTIKDFSPFKLESMIFSTSKFTKPINSIF